NLAALRSLLARVRQQDAALGRLRARLRADHDAVTERAQFRDGCSLSHDLLAFLRTSVYPAVVNRRAMTRGVPRKLRQCAGSFGLLIVTRQECPARDLQMNRVRGHAVDRRAGDLPPANLDTVSGHTFNRADRELVEAIDC